MKTLALFVFSMIVALSNASAQTADHQQVGVDLAPAASFDYVQQAQTMTWDGTSLGLQGVSSATLYFSDRPYRVTGQVDTATFANLWKEGASFALSPPNAAISILGETGKAPAVVELTSISVDGANITYGARVISGELQETAENVALFIDRGPLPAWHGRVGYDPAWHGYAGYYPHHPLPGPYCYHAPQDPECHRHPYYPYPPYPPYHPYYPYYYHPGAAYAAGVATGTAATAAQPVYVYPIPSGPIPANCYINSSHTQMICSVPIQQ